MEKLPFSIYDFFGYLSSGLILSVVGDHIIGHGWVLRDKIAPVPAVFLLVLVYIVGHINANLASFFLEQNFVARVLRRPNKILFSEQKSLPWVLRNIFPGYYSPLPKSLIDRINGTADEKGVTARGETLFHHARNTAKGDKETWSRLDTFLQLYGFCRNISFSLFASAVLLALACWRYDSRENGVLALAALAASVGMLYRYLKFYRQYSYEMFTAYPDLANHPAKKGD